VTRFVQVYLLGYVVLVVAALITLWSGGVLQRLDWTWVLLGVVIAIGFGVMLWATSRKSATVPE